MINSFGGNRMLRQPPQGVRPGSMPPVPVGQGGYNATGNGYFHPGPQGGPAQNPGGGQISVPPADPGNGGQIGSGGGFLGQGGWGQPGFIPGPPPKPAPGIPGYHPGPQGGPLGGGDVIPRPQPGMHVPPNWHSQYPGPAPQQPPQVSAQPQPYNPGWNQQPATWVPPGGGQPQVYSGPQQYFGPSPFQGGPQVSMGPQQFYGQNPYFRQLAGIYGGG